MQSNLLTEINEFGFDVACNDLFNKSKYLTKTAHDFFHRVQLAKIFTENENDPRQSQYRESKT